MSDQFLFPWISSGVLIGLAGAAIVWRMPEAETARRWAVIALTAVLALLLAASYEASLVESARLIEPWIGSWFTVDALNEIPLPLFAALALGVTILAPKRKVTPRWLSGILILTAATLAAYAANNLLVLTLAWAATIAPFLSKRFFEIKREKETPSWSKVVLSLSTACVLIGAVLLAAGTPQSGWSATLSLSLPRTGTGTMLRCAFIFLIVAVFLRKGLLPAHSWLLAGFERGPLLPLALLVNGHLGAFLIARVALPVLPDVAHEALPLLGDLGLLTAVYTALIALAERQPRRLLALLSISQASFILVGLESNNADGITGALVHWQVVAVASTILISVFTCLEARLGTPIDGQRFLGLAASAPRLAVFFVVGGLALVGLPLTLGFPAEDLLLHGTFTTHPRLGFVLPIVTALNAFTVIRLFALLFLGRPGTEVRGLADALPRERWVLTAALLFLLIGGIAPATLVRAPAAAAERLSALGSELRTNASQILSRGK